MWGFVIFGILVLVVLFWFLGLYNRLVALRNNVEGSWKQVDVQLQKRYDLIPNLVETVKGYATHEQQTFEKVIAARNAAMSAQGAAAHGQAETALAGAVSGIFALAENYPDLKANQNFLMLQQELANIENKIAYSRQHYNDVVLGYNTLQQQFPANLVAGMAGSKPAEFFEIEDPQAREVPKVSFSN